MICMLFSLRYPTNLMHDRVLDMSMFQTHIKRLSLFISDLTDETRSWKEQVRELRGRLKVWQIRATYMRSKRVRSLKRKVKDILRENREMENRIKYLEEQLVGKTKSRKSRMYQALEFKDNKVLCQQLARKSFQSEFMTQLKKKRNGW